MVRKTKITIFEGVSLLSTLGTYVSEKKLERKDKKRNRIKETQWIYKPNFQTNWTYKPT